MAAPAALTALWKTLRADPLAGLALIDMSTVRVDPQDLARLAEGLAEMSTELAGTSDAAADAWALGPGETAAALDDVLGNWRRERLLLAEGLKDLGAAAAIAGMGYLDTEAAVSRSFVGGAQ